DARVAFGPGLALALVLLLLLLRLAFRRIDDELLRERARRTDENHQHRCPWNPSGNHLVPHGRDHTPTPSGWCVRVERPTLPARALSLAGDARPLRARARLRDADRCQPVDVPGRHDAGARERADHRPSERVLARVPRAAQSGRALPGESARGARAAPRRA